MIIKKTGLVLAITFAMVIMTACGGGQYLSIGDQAIDFNLENINGEEFRLSQFLGDAPVLLYFSMADG